MSLRYFESEGHAKAYKLCRPSPPPALTTRLIQFLREKYDGPLKLAVDLGCGNGQCAFTMADKFSSVLGTDISPAQIAEARKLCNQINSDNVKFEACSAEKIPVPEASVQLITICEAAHWMDLPKVYDEARRVLVKDGVLAIVGYWSPTYTTLGDDEGKSEKINQIIEERLETTQSYWAPQVWSVFREYSDISIPFSDFTRERGYMFEKKVKISDMLGSIRSYSSFQCLVKDKGENAGDQLLDHIASKIINTLNEGRQRPLTANEIRDYELSATWSYFLLIARV